MKKIIVGRFGKPFGIKGWIKVNSFTDPPENILLYDPWLISLDENWKEIEVEDSKMQGQNIIAKLVNCNTPEEAKAYTHKDIAISRSQLPKLEQDEYYWTDLEDMSVLNTQGIELGKVVHFIATGANDVMVVKGEKEHLVPYIDSVIISVDQEKRVIIVDWDESF
jgi:16S rRNA processing protein RimM